LLDLDSKSGLCFIPKKFVSVPDRLEGRKNKAH